MQSALFILDMAEEGVGKVHWEESVVRMAFVKLKSVTCDALPSWFVFSSAK